MLTMMPMAACDGSNADPILPEQPGQPGNSDGGDEDDSTNPTNPIPGGNGRYWYFYCSRTGSTERMAQQIQQTLIAISWKWNRKHLMKAIIMGCSTVHRKNWLLSVRGIIRRLKTSVEDFGNYDIVFVGYPIWYGSMATPMQTFLHNHASKLAGKRIALFCQQWQQRHLCIS